MEIQSGNIKLVKLTASKIERLRIWRNQRQNNEFLINRKEITSEAQELWFKKTQHSNDLYFIIQYEKRDVGLIYTTKTNLERNTVETNILIGESTFKKSGIALKSSLIFTNYLLNEGGFSQLNSVVNKNHKEGLELDQFIGFEIYSTIKDLFYLSLNLNQFENSKGYVLFKKLNKMHPVSIIE